MKHLSLTIQKLWPTLKFFVDKQKNRQTGQKLYNTDPSITVLKSNVFCFAICTIVEITLRKKGFENSVEKGENALYV